MKAQKMRTDALLSRYGYCSRREATFWVKAGRVSSEDVLVKKPDEKVDVAIVLIDGEPVDFPNGVFVAYYKPIGCTCSHDEGEGELIYDLLPERWSHRNPVVTSVGRLDKETSGLIFLTDMGPWVHRLTSPKHKVAKVYRFRTSECIPVKAIAGFKSGEFMLEDERTPLLPADLEILAPHEGRLTLYEGRYHQVRRMLSAVNAPVVSLHRESVGNISLEKLGLNEGEWCVIDPESIF